MIAKTPPAPYYAVIFTSLRTNGDHGYEQRGRSTWYSACHTRVCRVERDYGFFSSE